MIGINVLKNICLKNIFTLIESKSIMNDVQTFTAVVGSMACNANCKFCVSKMTPDFHHDKTFNVAKFQKAAKYAHSCGANTFLITGKGEPLLSIDEIKSMIILTRDLFPIIELQTNGILLTKEILDDFRNLGLTTVSLSCVGRNLVLNKKIISDKFVDLKTNVELIHDSNLIVRLSTIMIKDGLDSLSKIIDYIEYCNHIGIDQIKLFPVSRPKISRNAEITEWVDDNSVSLTILNQLKNFLNKKATKLMNLAHGDTIYSYQNDKMRTDQNVSFGSCLTESGDDTVIRQVIYCSDNKVRYSWQFNGAILF